MATPSRVTRPQSMSLLALVCVLMVWSPAQVTARVGGVDTSRATRAVGDIGIAVAGAVSRDGNTASFAGVQDHDAQAGEHEDSEHGPSWAAMGFRWINFLSLLGLLWWLIASPPQFVIDTFSFPGLRVHLRERREAIHRDRRLATDGKKKASQELQDLADRLTKVDDEVAALLTQARQDAERERQRADAAAHEEAERIGGLAHQELRSERLRARRELREHAAKMAVENASLLLAHNVTTEDQHRLVGDYVEGMAARIA